MIPFRRSAIVLLACCSSFTYGGEPVFRQRDSTVSQPKTFMANGIELTGSATVLDFAAGPKALYTVDTEGRVQRRSKMLAEPELLIQLSCEPACAAFAPAAQWLAYADSVGGTYLWQRSTNRKVPIPIAESERTVSLEFSPNGALLGCASQDGSVCLWNIADEKLVQRWKVAASSVQLLAFSPDSQRLAVSSFGENIKLFDVGANVVDAGANGPARTLDVGLRVTALGIHTEGQIMVATTDGSIRLLHANGQSEPIVVARHPCATWSLSFDASKSRMAAGSWDGTLRIWETDKWQMLQSLKIHHESITGMSFADRFGLVSAGLDNRLLAIPPERPAIRPTAVIDGRTSSVWVAIRSPKENHLFVGGRDGRFELWDLQSQSMIASRRGHPTTRCAAFAPDGTMLVTGGDDGRICIRDAKTGTTRRTLTGHPGALSALVFARIGSQLVSVCDGGVVKLWDVNTGEALETWHEHKHQVYCAAISPSQQWLITGGGQWTTGDPGELIVWNLRERKIKARLKGHKLAVWSIVFTPDGERFASSDSTGAVIIWNMQSLRVERTLTHSMWVRPLAMSPDGGILAVGRGDGSIRLWDTDTWQEVMACDGHTSFSFHLQFDPTGQLLTSGGDDGTVQMWPVDFR